MNCQLTQSCVLILKIFTHINVIKIPIHTRVPKTKIKAVTLSIGEDLGNSLIVGRHINH